MSNLQILSTLRRRPLHWLAAGALVAGTMALGPVAPAWAAASTCLVNGVPTTSTTINGTAGVDAIVCADGIAEGTTVDGKGGADVITVTTLTAGKPGNRGEILGGPGNDIIAVTGALGGEGNWGDLYGGDGNDSITVLGGASLNANRPGGDGNRGQIWGGPQTSFVADTGADTISVTGGISTNASLPGGIGNVGAIRDRSGGGSITVTGGANALGRGGDGNAPRPAVLGALIISLHSPITVSGGAGLNNSATGVGNRGSVSGVGGTAQNPGVIVRGGAASTGVGGTGNLGFINGGELTDYIRVEGGAGPLVRGGIANDMPGVIQSVGGDDTINLVGGTGLQQGASNTNGATVLGGAGTDTCNFTPANQANVTCEAGTGH